MKRRQHELDQELLRLGTLQSQARILGDVLEAHEGDTEPWIWELSADVEELLAPVVATLNLDDDSQVDRCVNDVCQRLPALLASIPKEKFVLQA